MCGIACLYSYRMDGPAASLGTLRSVRDAMAVRGPDDTGEWVSKDSRVALGHRRLSIIDLSQKGRQPMQTPDGLLTISFNGEIYNYRELRNRLEAKGCYFSSGSDTEVLLWLYREMGEAMLGELRGMFAFVLWDERKKALFCARDPYGIKPLYYADDGKTIYLASQVKAVLASGAVSRETEPAGIVGFFLLGSVPEPFTWYKNIHAVPAGSFIWADAKGVSAPKSYFTVSKTFQESHLSSEIMPTEQILLSIKQSLTESVRYHFVSDVPAGIFLSSGVDSGALLSLAQLAGIHELRTLTLAFEEYQGGESDESPLAEELSKKYHTQHRTVRSNGKKIQSELPNIFHAMDQPSIDGINTYLVSQAAASEGWKVALSGLGSDELFGGYASFRDVPAWVRNFSWAKNMPIAKNLWRQFFTSIDLPGVSKKAAGLLEYSSDFERAYFLRRGLFMPWELQDFLDKETIRSGLERLDLFSKIRSSYEKCPDSSFAKVACMESDFYLKNQLLRDTDWASMAHSLELRTPYVDAKLLGSLAPSLARFPSDARKQMLKRALGPVLPAAILQRKKTGFSVPMSILLDSPEYGRWRKIRPLTHPKTHWSRRWAYEVYKVWQETA